METIAIFFSHKILIKIQNITWYASKNLKVTLVKYMCILSDARVGICQLPPLGASHEDWENSSGMCLTYSKDSGEIKYPSWNKSCTGPPGWGLMHRPNLSILVKMWNVKRLHKEPQLRIENPRQQTKHRKRNMIFGLY